MWAACDCGYTLNSTTDPDASYALFTELLETDFLHLYTLPDSISESPSHAVGWAPQAYNVSPSAARGPFGKSAEVENVVVNPLNKTTDWGGEGWAGGPPGLQIWVRGAGNLRDYVGSDQSEGGKMVRIGEIDSLREDVRYGTFRIGMKMSEEAGTCAAFFWVSLGFTLREQQPGTAICVLTVPSTATTQVNWTSNSCHDSPMLRMAAPR